MTTTYRAAGCSAPISVRLVFCRAHWFALPKPLRASIWQAYVPGVPSVGYEELVEDAVNLLAERDGVPA